MFIDKQKMLLPALERHRKSAREWARRNPEKARKNSLKWAKANPEKIKKNIQKWKDKNPEQYRLTRKRNYQNRRSTVREILNDRMSSGIRASLKSNKNGRSWESIVGYTLDSLIKRLKATIPDGYTWDDYINGAKLHIDHIVPISVHNFKSYKDIDFKRCWSLKNLQLLPAKDNIAKSNKLVKPFQMSLEGI